MHRSLVVYTEDGEMVTCRNAGLLAAMSTSMHGNTITITDLDNNSLKVDLDKVITDNKVVNMR